MRILVETSDDVTEGVLGMTVVGETVVGEGVVGETGVGEADSFSGFLSM